MRTIRRSELQGIGGLLTRAVARPEVLRTLKAHRLFNRWEEVVGPQLVLKCSPDRYSGGTLWVAVSGSAWAQELRMRESDLLKRLNTLAGEELFTEIRFGVHPLPERTTISLQKKVPLERKAVRVEVKQPELETALSKALGRLKAVRDSQKP